MSRTPTVPQQGPRQQERECQQKMEYVIIAVVMVVTAVMVIANAHKRDAEREYQQDREDREDQDTRVTYTDGGL